MTPSSNCITDVICEGGWYGCPTAVKNSALWRSQVASLLYYKKVITYIRGINSPVCLSTRWQQAEKSTLSNFQRQNFSNLQ